MLNNSEYLNRLFGSGKPLIIYKVKKGYDIFTDFSERIYVNKNNIKKFLKKTKNKKKNQNTFFEGYIGFFGYRLLCELIKVKVPKQKSIGFPKSIFYKPETVIRLRKKIKILSTLKNYKSPDNLKNIKNDYYYKNNFKVNLSLNNYKKIFNNFSKKIKMGETYQIKICQKYSNKSNINSLKFFLKLMNLNPSPESFLIRDKTFSIVSCSPETLIEKRRNTIVTKPIAGTMKKKKNTSKILAKKYFAKNEKETKEHNMIVDMERNDLSKICKTGSVKISKLKYVEEYRDLFHFITAITGEIKKGTSSLDIIKGLMPGGSVIGCPKINTLNLLNKQEKDDRNIYTGCFGYIKSNQDMRFNLIIRTILNYKNICEISVASGVVIDSTAKKEYEENFIKAKSLLEIFKK